jgi:hypothetical protein
MGLWGCHWFFFSSTGSGLRLRFKIPRRRCIKLFSSCITRLGTSTVHSLASWLRGNNFAAFGILVQLRRFVWYVSLLAFLMAFYPLFFCWISCFTLLPSHSLPISFVRLSLISVYMHLSVTFSHWFTSIFYIGYQYILQHMIMQGEKALLQVHPVSSIHEVNLLHQAREENSAVELVSQTGFIDVFKLR